MSIDSAIVGDIYGNIVFNISIVSDFSTNAEFLKTQLLEMEK
jgi:hypothetical protein